MDDKNFANVTLILNAFREFAEIIKKNGGLTVNQFIKFIEPKFIEAGYRQTSKVTAYTARRQTKILILHDAGAGDFVINTGFLREIRRLYPNAYIALCVKSNVIQLAELCPYVDEVIFNEGKFTYADFYEMFNDYIKLAEKFLATKFDICYSLAYLAETNFLMYLSGAKVRISINVYSDLIEENMFANIKFFNFKNTAPLSTKIVSRPQYRCHRVDMIFHILEELLSAPIDNRDLEIWYSPRDAAFAKNLVVKLRRPLYALCLGGSHDRKKYPPEKYAKFLELVVKDDPQATFIILGGGKNDLKSAQILKENLDEKFFSEHVIDLTNKANYRQSAAVINLCDAYIGNDTGTMHIAAALKIPVLCVNCFPADLKIGIGDILAVYYPYGVPNVIVRPKNALPECTADKSHQVYGCRVAMKPHCITQIEPNTIFDGLKVLKKRIAEKNFKPLYIF